MDKILTKIQLYLTYPSTTSALVFIAGLAGYEFNLASLDQIIKVCGSVIGLIHLFYRAPF